MFTLTRSDKNPILKPNPKIWWEAQATFNGCVIKDNDRFHMLYRAFSETIVIEGKKLSLSTVGYTSSPDATQFSGNRILIQPECPWEEYGVEDPRITKIDDEYIIFYTALSQWPPNRDSIKVAVAISTDLATIRERHLVTPFNAKAMTLFPQKIGDKYAAILSIDTDPGPSSICYATFEKKEDIWSEEYWKDWYEHRDQHVIPLRNQTIDQVEVGAPPVRTPYGWLLVYADIENYFSNEKTFKIKAVLLDSDDPRRIIGRIPEFDFKPEAEYELKGMINNIVFPSSVVIDDETLYMYYGAADTTCCVASCSVHDLYAHLQMEGAGSIRLHRYEVNPILKPQDAGGWESQCVLNAGAIDLDGRVHIAYRAMSADNTSVIGLAISDNGIDIAERLPEPIYVPRISAEMKRNPGGYSGCEDARLTLIDDTIYMCYTTYNGVETPRVGLSKISKGHFVARDWRQWSMPQLISPPGLDDKDACFLPIKVSGKYWIYHRLSPDICIDFVDDLSVFDQGYTLDSKVKISPRPDKWDSSKIGIGGVPHLTQYGWLLIYHGVSRHDQGYRLGAMLLDLKNPAHVVARSEVPILEPECDWEKKGIVDNVVFTNGSIIRGDTLYVYYGGADKVLGVATGSVSSIMSHLLYQ